MQEQRTSTWRFYLMEAAGLAGFVLIAGSATIFLDHPDLPIMQSSWSNYPVLRRTALGVLMGAYIWLTSVLWGKSSGAHFNPAVTWAFYRLGKIKFSNAVWYTVAQFAGAIAAALFLKAVVGEWFSHPDIHYGQTAPKEPFTSVHAFLGEFVISFILMLTILVGLASRRWEKVVPVAVGFLIAVYLVVELPLSGMSMNPARSTAGDVAAWDFKHLWIYFVSPIAAMLLATVVFNQIQKHQPTVDKQALPSHPPVQP